MSESEFLLRFVTGALSAAVFLVAVTLLSLWFAWRALLRLGTCRAPLVEHQSRRDEAARLVLDLRQEIVDRDAIIHDMKEDSLAYRLGYTDGTRGCEQEGQGSAL